MKTVKIAIDGPSGAGKSTIAKYAARQIGFSYVDTGALYRTVGYYFTSNDIALSEESLADRLDSIELKVWYDASGQHVQLNGKNVDEFIRTGAAGLMAAKVAVYPSVRSRLLTIQREIACCNNVVMDGRDIGTVVLPDADLKIFLTASVEDRAQRRFLELSSRGETVTFDQVKCDVEKRDYEDSHREISPLAQAADAVLLDTTGNSLQQSQNQIVQLIQRRLADVL